MLLRCQVCKDAYMELLSVALSAALVSVSRGVLKRLTVPSQNYLIPDRSVLLVLCPCFKISCYISLPGFSSSHLYPSFSYSKTLTCSLRELQNGSREGKIAAVLPWLQYSTLQLLSIISQSSIDWKGHPKVIRFKPKLKAGLRSHYSESCLIEFLLSPVVDISQPFWITCSSIHLCFCCKSLPLHFRLNIHLPRSFVQATLPIFSFN